MHKKNIVMKLEHAISITNDLLDVFQAFAEVIPFFRLSNLIENGKTKIITFNFKPDGHVGLTLSYAPRVKDDFCLDIIYKIIWNKRYFRITFFDDPDDLGYCSMLSEYDPSTYVLCEIVEERTDGSKKHEVTFGFDIENGTFLELFEILHYNAVGILREYPNNYWNSPIESALKDAILL